MSINAPSYAIFFGVVGTSVSSFIAGICIGLMIGKVGYLGKLVLVMLFEPCSFFCFFYLINFVLIIYLSYNIIADKLGIDYK